MSKRDENLFVATAVGALVLHCFAAHLWPTLAWPDEIFQTLEQGHRLVFGYGVIPWEFRDGVRSWVLPALLGGVMRATVFLGPGSNGYLLGVRLFLALCSMAPVIAAMLWARRAKLQLWWVAGVATAVWFELVFVSGKALTEVLAAYAMSVALYFSLAAEEGEPQAPRAGLWAGLGWGLAAGLRMHLLPAALVALAWTCRKDARRWKHAVPGFLGVVIVFGLVDWVTWSYPFQSFIGNFRVNALEGKAASFGVTPPWEYLRGLAVVWSWGALPLLALAASSFKRWPLLGVTAAIILLSHSVIAHKEYPSSSSW